MAKNTNSPTTATKGVNRKQPTQSPGNNKPSEQKASGQAGGAPNFMAFESNLGAVAFLSSKSPTHKHLFTSDLEWLVIPPISLKQFFVFRSKNGEPVAFVSWASVNEDVENRLLSGIIKLSPNEWNSGKNLWIVDIISPFANPMDILKEIRQGQFKSQEPKILRPKANGKGLEGKILSDFLKEYEEASQSSSSQA